MGQRESRGPTAGRLRLYRNQQQSPQPRPRGHLAATYQRIVSFIGTSASKTSLQAKCVASAGSMGSVSQQWPNHYPPGRRRWSTKGQPRLPDGSTVGPRMAIPHLPVGTVVGPRIAAPRRPVGSVKRVGTPGGSGHAHPPPFVPLHPLNVAEQADFQTKKGLLRLGHALLGCWKLANSKTNSRSLVACGLRLVWFGAASKPCD